MLGLSFLLLCFMQHSRVISLAWWSFCHLSGTSVAVKCCPIPYHFQGPSSRDLLQQKARSTQMMFRQFGCRSWTSAFPQQCKMDKLLSLLSAFKISLIKCMSGISQLYQFTMSTLLLHVLKTRQTVPGPLCHLLTSTVFPRVTLQGWPCGSVVLVVFSQLLFLSCPLGPAPSQMVCQPGCYGVGMSRASPCWCIHCFGTCWLSPGVLK